MNARVAAVGRAIGIVIPIVIGLACGRLLAPYLPQFTLWVDGLGGWAPVAFLLAYVLVVLLMLPAFLLTMAGGAVFGIVKGSALVMTGAMIGATLAFLIARYAARDFVARRIARNPKMAALDRIVGEDGRRLVFFLRLSPAVPFVLTNYALGVSRVHLRDFVAGTFGLLPIVVTYAAYGRAAGAMATAPAGKSPVSMPVLMLGIVATIGLGVVMTRIARKAFAEAERSPRDAPHE